MEERLSSLSDRRLNIISLGSCKVGIVRVYLYFIPLLLRPFIINLSKPAATGERISPYGSYAVAYRYARYTTAIPERTTSYARYVAAYRYAR